MEHCQNNRAGCRQNFQNRNFQPQYSRPSMTPNRCAGTDNTIFAHVDHLPVAMAYVPFQKYQKPFDLCYALSVGTIFPDLCKPFCGRRCV